MSRPAYVQRRSQSTLQECLSSENNRSESRPPTFSESVGRGGSTESPGEVLVSDITYAATTQGWMCLAVTLDLFSRQVAGWHLAETMETALVLQAAQKATLRLGVRRDTIHHSDRGCQYTSQAFRAWLKQRGMLSSMSAAGYCYDKATCESFFTTLKREGFPSDCVFESKADARRTIFEYIETFYNRIRIHTSLENSAPNQIPSKHFHAERITLN